MRQHNLVVSAAEAMIGRHCAEGTDFISACETILARNEGCITPAEELLCQLIDVYRLTETISPADLEHSTRDYLESVDLMRKARPVRVGEVRR